MYKKHWLFLILVFVLALTAACGGDEPPAPADVPPVEEVAPPTDAPPVEEVFPPTDAATPAATEIQFPLPDDVGVDSVMYPSNGVINFQTSLSLSDAVTFYRFAFIDLGYVERETDTAISGDDAFSIIFDGHPSGRAIIVLGVNFGESVNINISFIDI